MMWATAKRYSRAPQRPLDARAALPRRLSRVADRSIASASSWTSAHRVGRGLDAPLPLARDRVVAVPAPADPLGHGAGAGRDRQLVRASLRLPQLRARRDASRNSLPLDFLMLGELFQNNHHRASGRLNFGGAGSSSIPPTQLLRMLDRTGRHPHRARRRGGTRRLTRARADFRHRSARRGSGSRRDRGRAWRRAARRRSRAGRWRSYQGRWSRPTAWWWVIVPPSRMMASAAAALIVGPLLELGAAASRGDDGVVGRGAVRVDVREAAGDLAARRRRAGNGLAGRAHDAGVEGGEAVPRDRGLEGLADHADARRARRAGRARRGKPSARRRRRPRAPLRPWCASRRRRAGRRPPWSRGALERAAHPRIERMVGRLEGDEQHVLARRCRRRSQRLAGVEQAAVGGMEARPARWRARPRRPR